MKHSDKSHEPTDVAEILTLEERVARLEGKVGWSLTKEYFTDQQFYGGFVSMIAAAVFCFFGIGLPNHIYQIVLAVLFVLLGYHRDWFCLPTKAYQWAIAGLNVFVLSMIFKLTIGGGVRYPFFWAQYPTLQSGKSPDATGIGSLMPQWQMQWLDSSAATYTIDLTILQTFLLLITIVGALFSFQPFVSLTAVMLVIVSVPSLMECNWDWVFPAIVAAAVGLYLQQTSSIEDR